MRQRGMLEPSPEDGVRSGVYSDRKAQFMRCLNLPQERLQRMGRKGAPEPSP